VTQKTEAEPVKAFAGENDADKTAAPVRVSAESEKEKVVDPAIEELWARRPKWAGDGCGG
jgi:hypothetical protein